jgi:predicted GH43/DUF377 family glycosyl hydrolase
MPKPSLYKQLDAVQVTGPHLPPSPRHWNCGLLRYKGRLWMCLRYHLPREHASRCATGMIALDKKTFQPTGPFQHLNLPARIGDEHFEDARLFLYKGEPYVSYTEMTGYKPGHPYFCTMKYARLKLVGSVWHVVEAWHPRYGQNDGGAREKNWAFFEHDKTLFAVYADGPTRKVIQLEGDQVVAEHESPGAFWPWGTIRGGTPPLLLSGGKEYLAIFHSSLATEQAPHYVRYYGAAYRFEAKPPFAITAISDAPLMTGSEEDGHGYDPRYAEGWKPFIPFPCGLVPVNPLDEAEGWLVSLGVNDWQCAVGRIKPQQLAMRLPNGSDRPVRYFRTSNGSLPVQIIGANGQLRWIQWEKQEVGRGPVMVPPGYYATADGREAEMLSEAARATEITAEEYKQATKKSA